MQKLTLNKLDYFQYYFIYFLLFNIFYYYYEYVVLSYPKHLYRQNFLFGLQGVLWGASFVSSYTVNSLTLNEPHNITVSKSVLLYYDV